MTGESFGLKKHGMHVPMTADLLDSILSWRPAQGGHYREIPKDPKWLAARATFVEQFERLAEFGREQGFLEHEGCYECSGPLVGTTEVVNHEWVAA